MKVVFAEAGDFAAVRAAEDWCEKHGLSVGAMERGKPRGLLFGDYAIAKWRNLRQADKDALHGTMTGDMRSGPVTVTVDAAFTSSELVRMNEAARAVLRMVTAA
jgi:hypothetical protein